VTPTKKPKRERTKAEKEELKKKLKYFKMVCGGQFDGKNEGDLANLDSKKEAEVAN
jgi:hypothetical protein